MSAGYAIAFIVLGAVLAFGIFIVTGGMLRRPSVPEPVTDRATSRHEQPGDDAATWQRRARAALTASGVERRRVVTAVLPILDDLHRAQAHHDLPPGVVQIVTRFEAALREVEVYPVAAEVGQRFDPRHHEAVSVAAAGSGPAHVIEVIRRGYVDTADKSTLIRPALVVVARAGDPS